jgi:hypothetical protein
MMSANRQIRGDFIQFAIKEMKDIAEKEKDDFTRDNIARVKIYIKYEDELIAFDYHKIYNGVLETDDMTSSTENKNKLYDITSYQIKYYLLNDGFKYNKENWKTFSEKLLLSMKPINTYIYKVTQTKRPKLLIRKINLPVRNQGEEQYRILPIDIRIIISPVIVTDVPFPNYNENDVIFD